VSGACDTHGRGEKSVQGFVGKPEGRTPFGRPRRTGESEISEWMLGTFLFVVWSGFSWLSIETVTGCYQHGEEHSGSDAMELFS
jgi:hypothetical protein